MARANWKGPYFKNQKVNNYKNIGLRNSEIMPSFVGKIYYTHNGKSNIKIIVLEEMVGFKFGEFSFTRKEFFFSKNNGTKS
jgi:small subunit ribosomal protein S19|uniref:Ribosomal protein S19 n=1 Tax=Asterionella formosa TaxID=210441 RepID=A0A1J0RDA6_9STRA|nr:ribosomal protein S19 [Asterionella formosa]APD75820.1 ribosomal protein S19 [Asterionella formosa]